MIDLEALNALLASCCPSQSPAAELAPDGEVYVDIPVEALLTVVQKLMETDNWHHVSALTGIVEGEALQVLYHLWLNAGLTLRVRCARDRPMLPSLVSLIPGVSWYEREVHDLLGIVFDGHPDLAPLLLPDEWDGPPPLLDQEDV